jgi:hypothetical protein
VKHRLTASKLELGSRCLWWARPDVELPAGSASAAAELGTAFHRVADEEGGVEEEDELDEAALDASFRRYVQCELEPAAGLAPAARAELERLVMGWRAWWDLTVAGRELLHEREKAFALGPSGGRRVESAEQRDYSAVAEDEVPGTVDLVYVEDGLVSVVDYKTGRGPHRVSDHEAQLRHLGAAVAKVYNVDRVRVAIAHVTTEDHGLETPVVVDELVLDALDLEIAAAESMALLARVPNRARACTARSCGARRGRCARRRAPCSSTRRSSSSRDGGSRWWGP